MGRGQSSASGSKRRRTELNIQTLPRSEHKIITAQKRKTSIKLVNQNGPLRV
jgi:hypothetical protein